MSFSSVTCTLPLFSVRMRGRHAVVGRPRARQGACLLPATSQMRAKNCACHLAAASPFSLSIMSGPYTCAWPCCVCVYTPAHGSTGRRRAGMHVWEALCGASADAASRRFQGKKTDACHVTAYVMSQSACDARSMRFSNSSEHGELRVTMWPASCCVHAAVCRREAR